ncbi:DUF4259 domain-containing protein [Kitasatospora sp. NA04385]|uniref:DUF4259 domain-containing protein n=1 Tax=Kitasatospora sp. NA04385 TaxID=2742135 RepID=UPI0015921E65|nr:DUF4259 domain-containing protein [Kitasatospora sp. NA04385]QKW18912.1 DUF4259 domain-containing protein [Kitasatospora sp. NA04385]
MGTWATGPFDNDVAADFADGLDEATPERRAALVRTAPTRALRAPDGLDHSVGLPTVAAAALVAAQCPGGEPVTSGYGPQQPLPSLVELRPLAARVVARALGPDSDLVEGWCTYAAHLAGRVGAAARRPARARAPVPGQDTLF